MVITVRQGDRRPPFVQGLEDITVNEILRIRKCVFTNLNYGLLGQSDVNPRVPERLRTRDDIQEWVFRRGILICRWVHILELQHNDISYGGETRRMFKREATDFPDTDQFPRASSEPTSVLVGHIRSGTTESQGRKRTRSVQEVTPNFSKRFQQHPQKSRLFTFGDGFCGAGGVSEGARQAGYKILWGLELDPYAMEAYRLNFPSAMHLEMDAHEFPDIAQRSIYGCDHLHMSCPCRYWSPAQQVVCTFSS